MTSCDRVPLGEICTVNPRAARRAGADDTLVTFVSMTAVDPRTGTISVREQRRLADVANGFTAFEEGDVLFAKITPCMQNGKAAIARRLTNGIGRGSTEFYVLRPGPRILGEYVWHFVRQPQFREAAKRSFTGTAGQQRVPRSFMETASIPLPPLDEQRRIVDILNRAARIETLQRRAAERLREFVPALFVKMFGDPVENPMGWPTQSLGDCCVQVQYGTSTKANDCGAGVPVLRMGNVTFDGALNDTNLKHVALSDGEIAKYGLRAGDILFNRTNSRELVGKTGMWDGRFPAVAASYFVRLRLDESRVCPAYVWAMLNSAAMKLRLFAMARGAIGQANINARELKSIPLPVPPVDLQRLYGETVEGARAVTGVAKSGATTAAALTASLVSEFLQAGASERVAGPWGASTLHRNR